MELLLLNVNTGRPGARRRKSRRDVRGAWASSKGTVYRGAHGGPWRVRPGPAFKAAESNL